MYIIYIMVEYEYKMFEYSIACDVCDVKNFRPHFTIYIHIYMYVCISLCKCISIHRHTRIMYTEHTFCCLTPGPMVCSSKSTTSAGGTPWLDTARYSQL